MSLDPRSLKCWVFSAPDDGCGERTGLAIDLAHGSSPWNVASWSLTSSICAMGRSVRSVFGGRPTVSGRVMTYSWISGASRSEAKTWVTLARVRPSLRAISAWVRISPASSYRCHSWAILRSSITFGGVGAFGSFRFRALAERALTVWSSATCRFKAPTFPFWNAPLGPRAISTLLPQDPFAGASDTGSLRSWAKCTIRSQISDSPTRARLVDRYVRGARAALLGLRLEGREPGRLKAPCFGPARWLSGWPSGGLNRVVRDPPLGPSLDVLLNGMTESITR